MRALLLLDVQNDFSAFGTLAVPEAPAMVAVANQLLAKEEVFEVAIATQNWHPANHVSFAASHYFRYPGQIIMDKETGATQRLWPIYGVEGSFGADLMSDLEVARLDLIVKKGQDAKRSAYSAFAPSAMPALGPWLLEQGVTDVYLGGFFAEYGILETALDGACQGWNMHVLTDLCVVKGWEEAGPDTQWLQILADTPNITLRTSAALL